MVDIATFDLQRSLTGLVWFGLLWLTKKLQGNPKWAVEMSRLAVDPELSFLCVKCHYSILVLVWRQIIPSIYKSKHLQRALSRTQLYLMSTDALGNVTRLRSENEKNRIKSSWERSPKRCRQSEVDAGLGSAPNRTKIVRGRLGGKGRVGLDPAVARSLKSKEVKRCDLNRPQLSHV